MMSDRLTRQNAELLGDQSFVVITASGTLEVYEHVAHIDSTAGVIALAMPPVAACKGGLYTILVSTYVSAITLTAADSHDFTAPTLNGQYDGVVLYSDGERWWEMATRT